METTQLGYPVVSTELYKKLFGKPSRPTMNDEQLNKAKKLLESFDIPTPVKYPNSIYAGEVPLLPLKGKDLKEHYELIAKSQVGHYKDLGEGYSKCKLPPVPPRKELVYNPGWTRYSFKDGKWDKTPVDFPLEDAFTFDTETFVHGGAFPVIGTALSAEAAYIWLAKELIDPTTPVEDWDQFNFIPIGENRFVVGHNISYDRVRTQEAYNLERCDPENFYFDTLSAHIAVSGLASGQRWLFTLSGKDPESLTDKERRSLNASPEWLTKGSTNSMVQVYNFHVYEPNRGFFGDDDLVKPLTESDKKVRDIFVKATGIAQITAYLEDAVNYAIWDAYYTAEIFQALWPKYIHSTPSMVALCGHYHLNGSIVPLAEDWKDWVEGTDKVYNAYNEEMTVICKDLVKKYYQEWKVLYEEDPLKAKKWVLSDPWIKQLDWEVKTTKGKYAHVPQWMRPFIRDPDAHVGVKSRLAHLLLKLKWEGEPLTWVEGRGWCYWTDGDDDAYWNSVD
jgi:DNA polymerase gamma 1